MTEIETLRLALAAATALLTSTGACNSRDHWYPVCNRYLDRAGEEAYLEPLIDAGVDLLSKAMTN